MSKVINKYTVIREYKNECSIDDVLKNIIRSHIRNAYIEITDSKECSNHEVQENEEL